jgi:hypothetical protein
MCRTVRGGVTIRTQALCSSGLRQADADLVWARWVVETASGRVAGAHFGGFR